MFSFGQGGANGMFLEVIQESRTTVAKSCRDAPCPRLRIGEGRPWYELADISKGAAEFLFYWP